ncbi:MAG: hypothetical protein DKM50_04170 [Candidatus Margulisiibacteriota bacterium]|nr:MAG: hypothetical protein DKM50_04170 [Candidatus Margulisiibacteriota bacterium]
MLSEYGIKVIRFTNQEINNNFNGVCQRINDELPLSFASAQDIPLDEGDIPLLTNKKSLA